MNSDFEIPATRGVAAFLNLGGTVTIEQEDRGCDIMIVLSLEEAEQLAPALLAIVAEAREDATNGEAHDGTR